MNARPNARHHNERRAPTCVAPQQPLRRASRKVGACEARHHARNSTGALFPRSRAERAAPGTAAASAAHQPRSPLPRPATPLPSVRIPGDRSRSASPHTPETHILLRFGMLHGPGADTSGVGIAISAAIRAGRPVRHTELAESTAMQLIITEFISRAWSAAARVVELLSLPALLKI